MRTANALAALALLAGCGGTTDPATEGAADRLEEAAEQSTPAAAEELDRAADNLRAADGSVTNNANAQINAAVERAADAQANETPGNAAGER